METFLTGSGYWQTASDEQIPSLFLCDGTAGLRIQRGKADYFGIHDSEPARLYPCEAGIGCSWDEQLAFRLGLETAKDMQALQADVLLGPCIDHKRSPLAGRNFESYSEDPLLSGRMAAAYMKGIHAGGKRCCLKHLACNTQEQDRMHIDMEMDPATLHGIYLKSFEETLKREMPDAIMLAYPRVKGTFCTEHKFLMDQMWAWGFQGLFMSDWGAVNDPGRAFGAGLDLEMPGCADTRTMPLAVYNERTRRKLARLQPVEKPLEAPDDGLLLQAAVQSIVKVKEGTPVDVRQPVAVAGWHGKHPHSQGSGSSRVNPVQETDLVSSWPGEVLYAQGTREDGTVTEKRIAAAQAAAKAAGQVIVVIGLSDDSEAEGTDRTSMALPEGSLRLVQAMLALPVPVTLVVQAGAPVRLDWWEDLRPCDQVYIQYPGGQKSGQALAEVLSGKAAACGFLAETWPLREEDVPCHPWWHQSFRQAVYGEGCFTGYRYYESFQVPVRFPFGYGIGGHFSHRIKDGKLRITNRGEASGTDLICFYALQNADPSAPIACLADWQKVQLEPGESRELALPALPHLEIRASGRRIWRSLEPDGYRPHLPVLHPSYTPDLDWNMCWKELKEGKAGWLFWALQEGWAQLHPESRPLLDGMTLRQLVLAGMPRSFVSWLARTLKGTL